MAETSPRNAIVVIVLLVLCIVAGFVFLRDKTPPGKVTEARLAELRATVEEHAKKYGAPPASISELAGENPFTDAWDHPLTYRLLPDGRVEIGSLGGDGEPGGHMFKADKFVTFTP